MFDGARFTVTFEDLRGYGRSRAMTGAFTVKKARPTCWPSPSRSLGAVSPWWADSSELARGASAGAAPRRASEGAVLLTPLPPASLDPTRHDCGRARAGAGGRRDAAECGRQHALVRACRELGQARERRAGAVGRSRSRAATSRFRNSGAPVPASRVTVPDLASAGEQDLPPMYCEAVRSTGTHLRAARRYAAVRLGPLPDARDAAAHGRARRRLSGGVGGVFVPRQRPLPRQNSALKTIDPLPAVAGSFLRAF